MATPSATRESLLARGRAAARGRAWRGAYEDLARADAASPLGAEDLVLYATAAHLLGHADAASDAFARAHLAHLGAGDPANAVRCAFWIVFLLTNKGDIAQASGWLGRCDRLLQGLPPDCAERGYLLLVGAHRLVAGERRYAEGRALADRVVTVARGSGDEDLLALGLNVAGRARIRAGSVDDGLALLDEAMVAVVSGSLSPSAAGVVYCSLIEACEEIADRHRAGEWTEALSRWCDRQRGLVTFTGRCLVHRSTILRQHGRWTAAEKEAKQACERFVAAADQQAMGRALYELAEVHRLRGELTAAQDAYRRASDWGRDPQPGLALLRLVQGRTEAAAASIRRVVGEQRDPSDRIRLLPAFVEIMLADGDLTAAEAAAAELTELADTYDTSALRAEAHLAHGAVRLAEDDVATALVSLRRACRMWRALQAPYDTARARALVGTACRRLGDEEAARLELDAARRGFTELGAASDVARLAPATPAEHYRLSRRELQVLRLVADGRSNQEIADELYLAVKTVERHVGSILSKLGVPSRTAAAAFAYQHDLI